MTKPAAKEWVRTISKTLDGRTGRSKYGAIKTTVDGIVFDSKKEAQRYGELKLLLKAREIRALGLQPEYPLFVKPLTPADKMIKIGTYIADFTYQERIRGVKPNLLETNCWQSAVEDVKGFRTALYRWKKKHCEAQYGFHIREI